MFCGLFACRKTIKEKNGMKKRIPAVCASIMLLIFCFFASACGKDEEYKLNESTFFLVMTNIQYYPESYEDKNIEFDCFTYDLTDVNGKTYRCGVRKCSAGYGCKCGKDTVIGFILDYADEIPAPKNQSEDTNDKTWVHLSGSLTSCEKTKIIVYAYSGDGTPDETTTETIEFLRFRVNTLDKITDYSSLNYYVTK